MELLQTLMASFGGTAVALTVAGFLFKTLILNHFNRRMENYRTELRKELDVFVHRRNIELTRVDSQRSRAINEIWGRFNAWNDAYKVLMVSIVRLERDPKRAMESKDELQEYKEKVEALIECAESLKEETFSHSIYFDRDKYLSILNFGRQVVNLCNEFHGNLYGEYASERKIKAEPFVKDLLKASKQLKEDVIANNNMLRCTFWEEISAINSSLTNDVGSAQ